MFVANFRPGELITSYPAYDARESRQERKAMCSAKRRRQGDEWLRQPMAKTFHKAGLERKAVLFSADTHGS